MTEQVLERGSTLLVTGGTGFIGSAVARAAVNRGYRLRLLCRAGSDRSNLDDLDAEQVVGDLRDPESLAAAMCGCEGLIHVAADYRLWARDAQEIYRTNVDGTLALMQAAGHAGVRRVVYTSSVSTLAPRPDRSDADESDVAACANLAGHYQRSKWLAERHVLAAVASGLPAVVVNPSAPMGPGDVKPTPTGRIVLDTLRGRMPAFVNTGLNIVHVDDVANGHLLALERGLVGERYVLGGENLTLRDILATVCRIAGRRPPRIRLPVGLTIPIARVSEFAARLTGREPRVPLEGAREARHHMYFSSAKARRVLGYQSRPAGEAIADAVEWFSDSRFS